MEAIKQAVVQTLEKQGIIAQLKAQLRAQVFVAVEEYDNASSGSGLAAKTTVPSRSALLTDADGLVAVQLVLDLLDTCNFAFTKKVFQPELGPNAPEVGRQAVAQKLGLKPSSPDEPLIVALVKAFQSGSRPAATNSNPTGAFPAPARPAATGTVASASPAPARPAATGTVTSASPAPARPAVTGTVASASPAPARPAVGSSSTTSTGPAPARPAVGSSNSSAASAPARPAVGSSNSSAGPAVVGRPTAINSNTSAGLPGPSRPADTTAATSTTNPSEISAPSTSGAAPAPAARTTKQGMAPLPQLGPPGSRPSAAPAPAPAPAKPNPEPSAEEYSDDAFDDDIEEEGGSVMDDVNDDEDYAAVTGYKPSSGPGAKELGDGGRDRQGGGLGGTASSRGRTALDADLMAGDRSFGMSNELAGLDPGNSGGLSFSADFPTGGPGDLRASLSSSQAMLSPISEGAPKLAKLEPLRPIAASKLSPLGPLAPLPSLGTLSTSLSSSKDDPLGTKGPKGLGPLTAPVRKSMVDIEKEKDELRRMGLLQSGDSLSTSMEVETRPRGSGPPTNIYDAEMSVSASMDDGAWGGGGGGSGGGGRDDRPPFGSKGLSMDLRDTGLSASDRSGDIEQLGVDLAETAEWH